MQEAQQGDRTTHGMTLGPLYTWWRGDPLPYLPSLSGWAVETPDDISVLATLHGISVQEIQARVEEGHRPYIARLGGEPVAYGWSATQRASIGALDLTFDLPPGNHYLWDFATVPAWRGRGIYPRLLQSILIAERDVPERFWIGHDAANTASAQGIVKAGFRAVGTIHGVPGTWLALSPEGLLSERAAAGAAILGLRMF